MNSRCMMVAWISDYYVCFVGEILKSGVLRGAITMGKARS